MAKQTFTTGQVLTAAQVNSLQANDFNQTVSVKTANYTLAAADKGTRIEFNTSGSVTCTVNSGLFDAGDTLVIQNRGAGTATITAGTATVNTSASLALAQYSAGTLYFVSDSAALFFGDAAGISASIVDAKGDLIVGTADNTVGRLAVGTNGYTLVADSAETTGLKWQAAASSPLTTKGDIYTYSTADARLGVGANDLILMAASGETTGLKWGGAWTTWTPTYSNLTVGNGTVIARYVKIGSLVVLVYSLFWGSTSSFPGGSVSIGGLPYAPKTRGASLGYLQAANVNRPFFFNFAPGDSNLYPTPFTTDSTYAGRTDFTSTVPGTWASGSSDFFAGYIVYEVN